MRRENDNITILYDTLASLGSGWYAANGPEAFIDDGIKTYFKLSPAERNEVQVYMPEDDIGTVPAADISGCIITCDREDTVTEALKLMAEDPSNRVLALNFCSPVHPGGGVRVGMTTQEEDICRRSSLLPALESREASSFYSYHKSLSTYMGSDAIILTPNVEVFKDREGQALKNSVVISVLTCPAPNLINGFENLDFEGYTALLEKRIRRMLTFAAAKGYRRLVLGAWGCGAYDNDAAVVSDAFRKVLDEPGINRFTRISFAVTGHRDSYNFDEFARNFG